MNCELFQDGSCRSNRIRTAEERKPGLFSRCDETPGRRLVSGNVPVCPGLEPGGSDTVCICNSLDIRSIVETVKDNLAVRGYHLGMLLAEFLLNIIVDILQRAAVDEAGHSEGEHVLALVQCHIVQSAVLEAFLDKPGDRGADYVPVLNVKFFERVSSREARLGQPDFIECVRIDEDSGIPLEPFGIGLQCRRIHCDQHVAEISGSVYLMVSDMDLKTGYSGNRPLRRSDLRRIIRKCRQPVSENGGHVREQCSGQLHSVTGIPGEPDHYITGIDDLMFHSL